MITRKRFLSTFVGLPPLLLSFLIGKEEEKSSIADVAYQWHSTKEGKLSIGSKPDVIVMKSGRVFKFLDIDFIYLGKLEDKEISKLIHDGLVVETNYVDEKGTFRKEVRYRL